MRSGGIKLGTADNIWWGWLVLAAVALACLLINPIGYLGGGGDDSRYLVAARCWGEAGQPCLPDNHWAARWPLLAPVAFASSIFGETRWTIGLGPLLAWAAAIALLAWLGRLWLGRIAALVAAVLLAATPVFTQGALQLTIDNIELAFQLAALVAATLAYRSQSKLLAIAAGALAALAVQSRETSFLFCAAAALAWLLLDRERRKILVWAILGFVPIMVAEIACYAVATGDPFYRYRLSVSHVAITSEELPPGFDLRQSPLFNPAYIAAWRREMGIHWAWPIDPWLNLLASPLIGHLLIAAMLLAVFAWRWVEPPARRILTVSAALALLVAVLMIYGLAIDPKSRIFLLLAAAAALAIGGCVSAAARSGRSMVPVVLVILLVADGLRTLSQIATTHEFEALAERWLGQYPGEVAVDRDALTTLALVPGIERVPLYPAGRPLRLAGGNRPCRDYGGRLVDQSAISGGGQVCLIAVGRR